MRTLIDRGRRAVCEFVGVDRYSRPSLYGIDRKLERWLNFRGGFFVEAGANDGFDQSNTYYFEKMRGWRGILIEPIPELAAKCRRNRSQSVVEAALVSRERDGETVLLHQAGLMSTISGALGGPEATARHVADGLACQHLSRLEPLQVRGRALSSILDALHAPARIDLLSLDVEGAEAEALAGLDMERHAPRFICVEERDQTAIQARLGGRYRLADVLFECAAYRDALYQLV